MARPQVPKCTEGSWAKCGQGTSHARGTFMAAMTAASGAEHVGYDSFGGSCKGREEDTEQTQSRHVRKREEGGGGRVPSFGVHTAALHHRRAQPLQEAPLALQRHLGAALCLQM
jgi:hypothetical protein